MTRVSRFEKPRLHVDIPALLLNLGINDTRREGRTIHARCPAHPDRDPSWSIIDDPQNARNGFHHCFSCQFGGGAVALVREVRQCSTDEAIEWLKGTPQREVPLEVDVVVSTYSLGTKGMQIPSEVKVRPFDEWPEGARDYLEHRQITEADVVRYDIGFSLSGRLAGRIVLPMKDRDGVIQSYTARDFTGQGKRYKEPQAHEGARKGALFGEHLWHGCSTLVVTEGCFDEMAVARLKTPRDPFDSCGLHGSTLHPIQAVKFSRYARIIVATDPDPAGDRVAEEIGASLGRYADVRRARPPEGHDCANLDEKLGAGALRELIQAAHERREPEFRADG